MSKRRKVVAGLESNHQDNDLISIFFLDRAKSLPHTLPHIFINLTIIRFSFFVKKLNEHAACNTSKACVNRANELVPVHSPLGPPSRTDGARPTITSGMRSHSGNSFIRLCTDGPCHLPTLHPCSMP